MIMILLDGKVKESLSISDWDDVSMHWLSCEEYEDWLIADAGRWQHCYRHWSMVKDEEE